MIMCALNCLIVMIPSAELGFMPQSSRFRSFFGAFLEREKNETSQLLQGALSPITSRQRWSRSVDISGSNIHDCPRRAIVIARISREGNENDQSSWMEGGNSRSPQSSPPFRCLSLVCEANNQDIYYSLDFPSSRDSIPISCASRTMFSGASIAVIATREIIALIRHSHAVPWPGFSEEP
jgi:hypothetical protein